MNINFGLLPPIPRVELPNGKLKKLSKRERKPAYTSRALAAIDGWYAAQTSSVGSGKDIEAAE